MSAQQITVNGEERPLGEGETVASLLTGLGLAERKVAIERNLAIVPRSLFAETKLEPGDQLEVVTFVGGG